MAFFQNIKGKLSETVKNIAGPADPYERRLSELVERATDEHLAGPDWAVNIELVDNINNDPRGATDKVVRALKRAFLKPSINTQLLALTVLESCVKNCVPYFFQYLIQSDLWQEIMRVGDPGRRWDAEVRDRALMLIEDFGRGLPMEQYKEAYEDLLDRGVDFPARPPPEQTGVPYYTPPERPHHAGMAGLGPDDGLSPEDAAAINAALAQNEAEEAERMEREAALAPPGMPPAGHVPATMGPAVVMGAPIRPPGYRPPAGYHPPHPQSVPPFMATPHPPPTAAAVAGGAVEADAGGGGGGGAAAAAGGVPLPANDEEAGQAVRVALNSAELLLEMVEPIQAAGAAADPAAIQEAFITDLADQCYRYRSVLSELIPRVTSDELVSSALAANDELQRALLSYETLSNHLLGNLGPGAAAAAAAGGGSAAGTLGAVGSRGGSAAGTGSRGGGLLLGSAGGGAPAGGLEGPIHSSGGGPVPTFTLLGDEEEAEEEPQLQTNRGLTGLSSGGTGAAAAAAAPAVPAAAAVGDTSSSSGGADLISLSQEPAAAGGQQQGAAGAAGGLEQLSLKD